MANTKTAVLLVNTGTPDSPEVKDVRRYLREFLGDPKVINMPWLFRKMLVNLIIAPIRGPKSAKLYRAIWTSEGSPLLVNSFKFSNALQTALGNDFDVYNTMRYQNPSMKSAIAKIATEAATYKEIVLVPMYPQYADSTSGTIIAEFKRLRASHKISIPFRIVDAFFEDAGFINTFAEKIRKADAEQFDHVIFSFHGLPVKQTERMHKGMTCEQANCRHEYSEHNKWCYNASCYATVRLLAKAAGLKEGSYTVSFQSRLGFNWLKPYTEEVIKQKAAEGARKMLILSPAFVADCLETIHELGVEYDHLFREAGGEKLVLIDSLNNDPLWVETMKRIVTG